MRTSPLALLLLAGLPAAHAATFTVTRTDDPVPNGCTATDCSLREAVNAANARAGADTIVLRAATYNLTRVDASPDTREDDRGPLWIDERLDLAGVAIDRTRVRWSTLVKHYQQILRSGSDTISLVKLSDLTLSHGRGDQGGCLRFEDHASPHSLLVLERVRVENCHAAGVGGAMALIKADLSLLDAELVDNSTGGNGGALSLLGAIRVDSTRSVLRDNQADGDGGAVRITGSGIIGYLSNVVWEDHGGTVIESNSAGRTGGALSLYDTASLDLSTHPDAIPDDWLTISGNFAGGYGGGAYFGSGLTQQGTSNDLRRVRLLANRGSSGGAVYATTAVTVQDSEIAGNVATAGDGGGIALADGATWGNPRSIARVSLSGNQASGGGGAIWSSCLAFDASDAAIFLNRAASGRGQGIESLGSATLRHVTLRDNLAASPGLRKSYSTACAQTAQRVANSLIVDACGSTVAGQIVSDGGNQLGPAASACPALAAVDQRQASAAGFALGIDTYGGPFDVVGWPSDGASRPQRDFGVAASCSASDVRGVARSDGACDAGAFEQATP
jgi:CSLREA domain-containing protein